MACRRGIPLMSSGTETFSAAVSVGSKLKLWKTNPIISAAILRAVVLLHRLEVMTENGDSPWF